MIVGVRARVSYVEYYAVAIDLEYEILREIRSCGTGEIMLFLRTAVSLKPVLFKELSAKGTKTAHMYEGISVLLALRVLRCKILIKRLVLVVKVKHSARGMLSVAGILAVNVSVEIERVLMSLEDIVEHSAASAVHSLAEVSVVEIVDSREMSNDEDALLAVGVYLVHLILNPSERLLGVASLMRVEGGVGVDIDTDKINAVYNVMEGTPIKLFRLFVRRKNYPYTRWLRCSYRRHRGRCN